MPQTSPHKEEGFSWSRSARTAGVGVAMGAADIVPGVSGGTVALILGIYQRLLAALSRFDKDLLVHLLNGRLGEAWRHVDAWFLGSLGVGVVLGAKGLAKLMVYLLQEQPTYTYAAFFGLILASGVLVARMSRPESPAATAKGIALGILAACFAVWLMSQGRITPSESLGYTFVCGAVAICAMILPGISGAYLLLILGKYETISDILHRAPNLTGGDFATLGVFIVGCLVGLLSFSRLLKWLLANYWSSTMAVLAGFMIGSLYRVWPFQVDTTPDVEEFKLKSFEPAWPEAIDGVALTCAAIAVACFVLVLVVDHFASRLGKDDTPADATA
ncbi:hypothetical protein MalM25_04460 [Planctomycetes bacterium MalM25]|nr:hypothetical protein MalM25_04460 [Planctomycetes bacterium MalM25]